MFTNSVVTLSQLRATLGPRADLWMRVRLLPGTPGDGKRTVTTVMSGSESQAVGCARQSAMPGIFTLLSPLIPQGQSPLNACSGIQQHSGPEAGWTPWLTGPGLEQSAGDPPGHLRMDSGTQAVTACL